MTKYTLNKCLDEIDRYHSTHHEITVPIMSIEQFPEVIGTCNDYLTFDIQHLAHIIRYAPMALRLIVDSEEPTVKIMKFLVDENLNDVRAQVNKIMIKFNNAVSLRMGIDRKYDRWI